MKSAAPKKTYKSPRRKLVRFFEKSRDNWKEKYTELKRRVRYLENRIRYLEKSRSNWKEQAQAVSESLKTVKENLKIAEEKISLYEDKEKKNATPRRLYSNTRLSFIFSRKYKEFC